MHVRRTGHGEMHAMASALARLPARVVWKVSGDELARAGGAASLNLSANVKVRLHSSCSLHDAAACNWDCMAIDMASRPQGSCPSDA